MIRTQEMVPDWYPEKSRDFQILCRLYDYTLNGLKYNIETMRSLTDTRSVKDNVLPLVGDKFGIYDKEAYTNRHLLEALPIATKYKGSLKAVNIFLNAFLDSMDIFDFAVLFHSKDEKSAAEISQILGREVKPYSINVVFSSFPSLTNLHILDEYINRVIPSGFVMEYGFGITEEVIDTFEYREYIFLLYTHKQEYEKGKLFPYIGFVKDPEDKYSAKTTVSLYDSVFDVVDISNVKSIKELVEETVNNFVTKYRPIPVPPATSIEGRYLTFISVNERMVTTTDEVIMRSDGSPIRTGSIIRYTYDGLGRWIDISIGATVMSYGPLEAAGKPGFEAYYMATEESSEQLNSFNRIVLVRNNANDFKAGNKIKYRLSGEVDFTEVTLEEDCKSFWPESIASTSGIEAYYIVEGKDSEVLTTTTEYSFIRNNNKTFDPGAYVRYSYSGAAEFVKETLSDIDINTVSIATVVGGEDE